MNNPPVVQHVNAETKNVAALLFKDEDEERGMVIGPVWAQFKDGHTKPVAELEWPEGRSPAWYSKAQAHDMADALGVPLNEV